MNASKSSLILASALALGLTACASGGGYHSDRGYRDGYSYNTRCTSCGTVERIDVARYGDGRTTGGGAVAGAIVGGLLGSQVGSGDGRRVATAAGAIAGGVAGNRVERNRADNDVFAVVVRMDDGRRLVLEQNSLDGVREGARVQIRNGRVQRI